MAGGTFAAGILASAGWDGAGPEQAVRVAMTATTAAAMTALAAVVVLAAARGEARDADGTHHHLRETTMARPGGWPRTAIGTFQRNRLL